jgi:hypothetical protein
MWAAVRSAGAIAVEDSDFDGAFCHPLNRAFDFQVRAYCQVLARNGGDPTMGRKLYQYAQEAGIPDPALKLVQRVESGGEAKALPHLSLSATADAIVDAGIATADELNATLADLVSFLNDPTTIIGSARVFQLWAKR